MSSEVELWARRVNATETMRLMAEKIDLESTLDTGELDPSIMQIMSGIIGATDEDAIFAAANVGTIATKNFLNRPFLMLGSRIQWKRSAAVYQENNGFPWYALTPVTDLEDGSERVLNGGGWTYAFTLRRLQETEAFSKYEETGGMPMILTGKPAASGYTVVIPNKYRIPQMTSHASTKKA